ncbi:MAG: shikimate dehydrogenase [Pirellulaceae bacterium]
MWEEESLQDIVCCVGQPIAGNPTQFMMERAFAAADLDWRYLTLEVSPDGLGDAVRGMRAMGFRGGNFTLPHKIAVLEHLDDLTETAELVGAVNCVYRKGDRLIGDNTDGKSFVESLKTLSNPKDKKVVILGAGGAARAIAVEVGLAGAAGIAVVNRTPERGQNLVELLNNRVKTPSIFCPWEDDFELDEDTDIVINATSIGVGDAEARVPLDFTFLQPHMVVADVIVNPPETRLLRDAAENGCRTLDSLGMLVNQGVTGFKIWTGIEPDADVIREALEEFLEL